MLSMLGCFRQKVLERKRAISWWKQQTNFASVQNLTWPWLQSRWCQDVYVSAMSWQRRLEVIWWEACAQFQNSWTTEVIMQTMCIAGEREDSRAATEIQKQQKVLQVLLSNTPPILSTKSLLFQRATLARQRRLYYRRRKRFSGEIRPNTWLVAESLGTAAVDIVASCHSCRIFAFSARIYFALGHLTCLVANLCQHRAYELDESWN